MGVRLMVVVVWVTWVVVQGGRGEAARGKECGALFLLLRLQLLVIVAKMLMVMVVVWVWLGLDEMAGAGYMFGAGERVYLVAWRPVVALGLAAGHPDGPAPRRHR